MKNTKKVIFAMLLVTALILGLCSAVYAEDEKETIVYTSLGDSIAAGYGYYNTSVQYFGHCPGTYPEVVEEALSQDGTVDVKHYSVGSCGMSTPEMLYLLKGTGEYHESAEWIVDIFNNPVYPAWRWDTETDMGKWESSYDNHDYTYWYLNMYENEKFNWGNFGYYETGKKFLEDAIKQADVITLNIGANDILTYPLTELFMSTEPTFSGEVYEKIIKMLGECESESSKALLNMAYSMASLDSILNMLDSFITGTEQGLREFYNNIPEIVKEIQKRNGKAEIVLVGLYNPLRNCALLGEKYVTLGDIGYALTSRVNARLKEVAALYGCLYVDVNDTETYYQTGSEVNLSDFSFMAYALYDIHPTIAGHEYIGNQIAEALEKVNDVELELSGEFTNAVAYLNGIRVPVEIDGQKATVKIAGHKSGILTVYSYPNETGLFKLPNHKNSWVINNGCLLQEPKAVKLVPFVNLVKEALKNHKR